MPRAPDAAAPKFDASAIEEKLPNSVAVLPFENLGGDPDNQFLSDGISEELLDRLGSHVGLNVIGRTSSFQFRDGDYAPRRISDPLGSRCLLEGSVRRQDERLRISARLLDESGRQLWSEDSDRAMGDVFAIQID
jgi:TolB-like protein